MGGLTIPDGMVYVGQSLSSSGYLSEPSLIKPKLPIDLKSADWTVVSWGYWASYEHLSPRQRAAYLSWLASGRRRPDAPLTFPLLFLNGLERRVVADIAANPELLSELPLLRAELVMLRKAYGTATQVIGMAYHPFRQYVAELIGFVDFLANASTPTDKLKPPKLTDERWHNQPLLRLALGRFALNKQPIPVDWALAWAWFHPDTRLRTPATRCVAEFSELFRRRYAEKYPKGGMLVKPSRSELRVPYYAANQSVGWRSVPVAGVPDIFPLRGPGRRLEYIVDLATWALDPYSRWLSRNVHQPRALAGLALLPRELFDPSEGAASGLAAWAGARLDNRAAARITGADLIAYWRTDSPAKLTVSESTSLAKLLGHLGYGFEPDVRFGGQPLAAAAPVVLFRLPADAPEYLTSPEYAAASVLVHFAAAVGTIDGPLSTDEMHILGGHLESALHLPVAERIRLHAYLFGLTGCEIKLRGLSGRLLPLIDTQRSEIGNVLIRVACADGAVSPAEVALLQKIFGLLRLDKSSVTSRLHAALAGSSPAPAAGPVVVRPAGQARDGYRIPSRPDPEPPAPGVVRLDDDAVRRKEIESAAVAALLESLFDEGEGPARGSGQRSASRSTATASPRRKHDHGATPSAALVSGLDEPHSRLLRALATRPQLTRVEFEALASSEHLMPAGAIDTLNEAALDATDEPLIEGEDALTINTDVLQGLLA